MQTTTIEKITPQTLHQWMEAEKSLFLIDTLTNDHFQAIHLPGARHACVFEMTFLDQIAAITTDKHARLSDASETTDQRTPISRRRGSQMAVNRTGPWRVHWYWPSRQSSYPASGWQTPTRCHTIPAIWPDHGRLNGSGCRRQYSNGGHD